MTIKKDNTSQGKEKQIPYFFYHWGPCLVRLKVSETLRQMLLKEAYASRKEHLSYRKKIAGVIKEEFAFRKQKLFLPYFQDILNLYYAAYQNYKQSDGWGSVKKPKFLLRSLWCNFQKKHESNPPHDHSDSLSFVIYLQIPEELKKENAAYEGRSAGPGGIQFMYSSGADRRCITYQSHFPTEGDMFIFPASLTHYVTPFTSEGTRISVAGNIADHVPISALPENTSFEDNREGGVSPTLTKDGSTR